MWLTFQQSKNRIRECTSRPLVAPVKGTSIHSMKKGVFGTTIVIKFNSKVGDDGPQ